VTVAKTKGRRLASFPLGWAYLVGLLGLAALLLLLAALGRLATSLHLVDDEARVALLAVPLEAFEVGVGQLVIGLEKLSVHRH